MQKSTITTLVRKVKPNKNKKNRRVTYAPSPYASILRCLQRPGFPDRYLAGLETVIKAVPLGSSTSAADGFNTVLSTLSSGATGWTALTSVYNRYLVHRAVLVVTATNTNSQPARIIVVPFDVGSNLVLPLTVDDVLLEMKYAKSKVCSIQGGGKDVQVVACNAQISSITGLNPVYQSGQLTGFTGSPNSANAASSPSVNFGFYVSASTITSTNLANDSVWLSYTLYQEVEFFDRLPAGY